MVHSLFTLSRNWGFVELDFDSKIRVEQIDGLEIIRFSLMYGKVIPYSLYGIDQTRINRSTQH